MNIHLVIDADKQTMQEHLFGSGHGVEEVRWEEFKGNRKQLQYVQTEAYVGDSIFPALFLNTLTVNPDLVSILPNGWIYVSVTSK